MKRVLVTGARGFIGRQCLAPLLDRGFEIIATMSPGATVPADLAALPVTWRSIDLLGPGEIEALMMDIRPSHVLHMAWETKHGAYWSSPKNLDWLALGARFVRAFTECGGQRFVSAGTCAEYDWSHGFMVEDVTAEHPATFYGRIKLAHHRMLMASAGQFGFSAATGRIFFGYGPHEDRARVIAHACAQLAEGKPAEFGSGNLWRDFMHVDDIGRGFAALLDSDISGACHVSSGQPALLADLVRLVGEIAGRPDLIRLGARPDRPDDPPMLVGSSEKLRASGWEPRQSRNVGLAACYEWWRKRIP